MIIKTKYLGEVDVSSDKIITFTAGLPGFEEETEFVLLDVSKEVAFQLLQSTKTKELAFFVINPYLLYESYSVKLDDPTIEGLGIESEQDVVILSIVTLRDPFIDSTINLKAPIVINLKNRQGKQYILQDDTYSMRETIPQEKLESGAK